jgi:hypothetical protein
MKEVPRHPAAVAESATKELPVGIAASTIAD